MQNPVPKRATAVLTMAQEIAAGAKRYGSAIPLLQNPEADIRSDMQALTDAMQALMPAEDKLDALLATVRRLMDKSRAFLRLGRDNFKPRLGNVYNQGWDETGLRGSLMIPRSEWPVVGVLRSFKGFMENNRSFEVESLEITAANAGKLLDELMAARAEVAKQKTTVEYLRADRDQKLKKLRNRLRSTIKELSMRLSPLDAIYASFSLNKPGAVATPETPKAVTVTLIEPTTATISWPRAARAKYYRVWQRVVGVDAELIPIGTAADLDFSVGGLPPNATIELAVSAVNETGESAKTEPVTVRTG